MTTHPHPSVQVLAASATADLGRAPGAGSASELVLVPARSLRTPIAGAVAALAREHPGRRLAVDFGYSAGVEVDDRVAALLATIAHAELAAAIPAVLVLVAPVTLDEQCAAAAYAVAGGVTLIVSDESAAVERAVRVTGALRAHETIAEPVAR